MIKQFDFVKPKNSKSKRTGEVIRIESGFAQVLWQGNKNTKWHPFRDLEKVWPTS